MRHSIVRALGAAAVAAFAAACTTVDAAPAGAPAINVVAVTAGDYFYQMPDTLPAGLTTFRLINQGTELHHIQAVRLDDGKTLHDLMAHMAAGPGAHRDQAHKQRADAGTLCGALRLLHLGGC